MLLLPPKDDPAGIPRSTLVRPDIVAHRRGDDEENLLVIEVKKPGERLDRDHQKLRAFIQQLGYKYPAHVILGCADDTVVGTIYWVDQTHPQISSQLNISKPANFALSGHMVDRRDDRVSVPDGYLPKSADAQLHQRRRQVSLQRGTPSWEA